ncbi:hypothetical protein DT076_10375 [Desertihabitans brevis]|uniref:SAF domain-containing protein n=1 Tax=Desertihabitans brevis TaxID=2268447 RepID=A0A367YU32_9ACTN|nr:RcpC/CpaB family pilus assembly protein [Desertihabitans brevis]RCK69300.1 hypothetical protein DT076_10375 [Desertihabitans brevis]
MRRRVVAAVAAVVLAALGGALVLSYVSTADQRALAGVQAVDVLVVTDPVAEGTPVEDLGSSVEVRSVPRVAVPTGALGSLGDVAGLVAATDLVPGEPLLAVRFVDPAALATPGEVEVPAGLQEVSVLLDSQRVLGGHLSAGDHVGVFLTPEEGRTRLTLDQVLVTRVQGGLPAPEPGPEAAASDDPASSAALPESGALVTLALDHRDAERVVYTAEHGTLWLSLQDDETTEADSGITTAEEALR